MKTLLSILLSICITMLSSGCGTTAIALRSVADSAVIDGKANADTAAAANQALLCATTAGAAFRRYQDPVDWAAFERLCKRGVAP